ncbi:Kef-type transporter NAD-binding protein 2 [Salinarchaeum sp. Harcht-Bsk1]|uniref:NAD-binding protein n=1 Tax=Salinarchaeum sp. Harcht-Bsk1 TaxID=1333523 RepID=UPI0003423E68|nr:NAD-binding protein [Salinarchaeum sp. Harcht-Bsk1]AGN02735.1 Kef-type transporter NAD-binding protein 2 [Salinarchaeum sp. Harcht-Bsk1]
MFGAWTGKRLSVLLAVIVGVLSVLTGIANVGIGAIAVVGPLEPYVPETVRLVAGFSGAISGFLVLLAALGLRRGYRAAWILTIVLLPITAAQGLIQSSPLSLPLVVFSLLSMPTLVLSRHHFRSPLSLSTAQIAAGLALVGVQLYGTVGTYALREEFSGVSTVLDAFYFTLVTASTVGYGDVTPTTQVARLFTMSVLVFGTATFAIALGTLLAPILESRFAAALGRVRNREFDLLEDHVLVLGHGDLTEPIVDALKDRDRQFVVATRQAQTATELAERDVLALHADPSDHATLERANLDEATAVVAATSSDSADAFSVLTARQLDPEIRIVAAATNAENTSKLRRAGADVVVNPAVIGGQLLVGTIADRGDDGLDGIDIDR